MYKMGKIQATTFTCTNGVMIQLLYTKMHCHEQCSN